MTTLRQLAVEILSRYPGQYVRTATVCEILAREHPDIERTYRHISFNATVSKVLRAEVKYGTVEHIHHRASYSEWRLVQ